MYRDRLKAAMRSTIDKKIFNMSSSNKITVFVMGATRPALPSGYDMMLPGDAGFLSALYEYTSLGFS